MGAHSRSHFEICLHKNLLMAEKVHEIFPPFTLSGICDNDSCIRSIKWVHTYVDACVFCDFTYLYAKWLSWASLLPKRNVDNRTRGLQPMETFCTIGLLFADLTFTSGRTLIVHFAGGQIWIRQIKRLVYRSKHPNYWIKQVMYLILPPAWPLV